MKNFANKTVLVTGGASGIGKLMAEQFSERGACVVVVDINIEAALAVVTAIKSRGGKAHAVHADISNIESIKKCRSDVRALGLSVDVLINNAGVVFGGEFEKLTLEKHLLTYRINVDGLVALTHVFFDDLRKSADANIANIASASGLIGLPYGTTYASSKWAVIGFSESLRLELLERGISNIHVTTVCPSYISTGMFSGVKAPILVPWLKPEVIVAKIIKGIENNTPFIKEPFVVKWIDLLKGLFPIKIFTVVSRWLGVSTSMTHWKGRA
ncbi:MAG: SDR family NAD(P)-dependent oxidoreductase [Bdellovibrionales bacterium]|nr:SDR family NAD(P)-dependent oxidoreductase [Bdellovibrionales bacterium]